jgi:hypothetical protein
MSPNSSELEKWCWLGIQIGKEELVGKVLVA